MAVPKTTVWSMDRHTQAKHEILRYYLAVWLPILINRFGYARIIDGFAGPGEYEDGKIGSPLIVLETLVCHPDKGVQQALRNGTIELIFIERDPKRSQHLQQLLALRMQSLTQFPRLRPSIINGTFVSEMSNLLKVMERQHKSGSPIPTFVFIDPFGYSDTPLSIITRIMKLPMAEVLLNFMVEEINRFLGAEYSTKQQHYNDLFGTQTWQQLVNSTERIAHLHDLYRHQLLDVAGAKYVRSFRMRNKHNMTDYFLFFATNNKKGLIEMKRAMWNVDKSGNFEFSDFSNPYQPLLLTEPNYADLQRLLLNQFKGQVVSVGNIDEYVAAETPYFAYKQEALKPLEKAAKICLLGAPPKRRAGTFPDNNMLIRFL